MIYGIGIDIVHIPKFKQTIEKWGEKLENRLFTQNELVYCKKRRFPEQHLAARFAAKEALFKALGRAVRFSDIEVINNQDGRPYIVSKPKGLSYEKVVTQDFSLDNPQSAIRNLKTHLTLSHDDGYCIAQVILETEKEITV
ncbi:MAG: holo-ACP synthase [Deltaproteobacteria bacterium]|nr:holo-ACP synthase [Deltaproteobacteria bacterium]